MYIYFSGIRNEEGDYVVEVSHTADSPNKLMLVPDVFYMKFPLQLLTKTLETSKNQNLYNEMVAREGVTLVKSIRRNFGQKLLSSEPVTLETHWNIMVDRNILVRCSIVDKDGVERNVPAGASYETISMLCPVSSHLVGFSTSIGKPAMIFVTAQDESAKRAEDQEHDNAIQLYSEARSKYYDLELQVHDAEIYQLRQNIHKIKIDINSIAINLLAMLIEPIEPPEEKAVSSSSADIFLQLSTSSSDNTRLENKTTAQIKLAELLLSELKNKQTKAEWLYDRIDTNVKSIHAWDTEKKAAAEKKNAAEQLIAEGKRSAASNVVDAGLPATGELAMIMRTRADLENTLEDINADEEVISNQIELAQNTLTLAPITTSTSSTSVAIPISAPAPTSSSTAMEIDTLEEKTPEPHPITPAQTSSSENMAVESNSIQRNEIATPSVQIPSPAQQAAVQSPSSVSTVTPLPLQPQLPLLPQWLTRLIEQLGVIIDETENACTRLNSLKPDAQAKIKSVDAIINTVKSARMQRNKDIVNWPAAKNLIVESRKPFASGYTQWVWYHTSFPHLFVNYLFDLLLASESWSEISFTTLNTILDDQPLPIKPLLTKAEARAAFSIEISKQTPLTEDPVGIINQFIFGDAAISDALTLQYPKPHKTYKSTEAGKAELVTAQKQVEKLANIATELTDQIEETKKNLTLTVDAIQRFSSSPERHDIETLTNLRQRANSLELRIKKLQGMAKKAIETHNLAEKLLKELTEKNSANTINPEQNNMDVDLEQKSEAPVVIKSKEERTEERNKAAADKKNHEIANGLVTAIVTGNKRRFDELYPKINDIIRNKVTTTLSKKDKHLQKFNIFVQANTKTDKQADTPTQQNTLRK